MGRFCTFLVAHPRHKRLLDGLETRNDFQIVTRPDPARRHRFTQKGSGSLVHEIVKKDFWAPRKRDEQYGRLITLDSDSEIVANNFLQLFWALNDIIIGNPPLSTRRRSTLRFRTLAELKRMADSFFNDFVHPEELPISLRAAISAWKDPSLIYASHKLSTSMEAESVTSHSTHPVEMPPEFRTT